MSGVAWRFKWRSVYMAVRHSFNCLILKVLPLCRDSISRNCLLLTRRRHTDFSNSVSILAHSCWTIFSRSFSRFTIRICVFSYLICRTSYSDRLIEIFRNFNFSNIHSSMLFSKLLDSSQIMSNLCCLLNNGIVLFRAVATNTALFTASAWNLIL